MPATTRSSCAAPARIRAETVLTGRRRRFDPLAWACAAAIAALPGPALANPVQAVPIGGQIITPDGVSLHYVEAGKGPVTILAPVALYLAPVLLDALARDHRVVMYDPRNRGQSGAAPLDRVSIDHQIEDAEALRKALGLERIAILGWSGPGMELSRYALRYPERVSHLILMAPVPPRNDFKSALPPAGPGQSDDAINKLDAAADAGAFTGRDQDYCRQRARLGALSDLQDDTLIDLVADVCSSPNEWPRNLWPYFGRLLGTFGSYDLAPALAASGKPLLVIHGTADRIAFDGGEAWVACNPRARMLALPGVGHFVFVERKRQVVRAIGAFLRGRMPAGAYRPACAATRPA